MSLPTFIEQHHTKDKTTWGAGPWTDEPDKVQWRDEATGLPCLVVRGPFGALCGYVGVTREHPLYGSNYSSPWDGPQTAIDDITVHGGLTFANRCQPHPEGDYSQAICHRPEPGQSDDVWWFGFDCAHSGDLCPGHGSIVSRTFMEGLRSGETYRDLPYVCAEVTSLAAQLAAGAVV